MGVELRQKRIVVVGLGKSGKAAAKLCAEAGAQVVGTDSRPLDALGDEVLDLGIELALGSGEPPVEEADLVIVSPGVPPLAALDRAEERGVPVIGELEFASRFMTVPVIAVGGTNGKSTTTIAITRMLEADGRTVFSGGNLGTPLSAAVGSRIDVAVVEVSSFQLERAPTFHPTVAVLLNVTEDHLDRYPSFSAYAEAKGNVFVNQTPRDAAIVPASDEVCLGQAARGRGRIVTFGAGGDFFLDGQAIVGEKERYSLEGTGFVGRHNRDNAAASVATARAYGAAPRAIDEGLRRFAPLDHRMAFVAQIDGARYYDDSKATNVGAAVTALLGITEPRAVLIAGGRDKQGSYAPLADALESKGRAIVAIGEAAGRIAEAVGGRVPVVRAASMDEAVARARELARAGDAVLLSPACSSFDWYSGYAERGDRFVAAVRRLQAGRGR